MHFYQEAIQKAIRAIVSLDPLVIDPAARSLFVSLMAVLLAMTIGIPAGLFLARREFWGRKIVVLGMRTLMAVPTVFVGLVCYTLFSRQGPLGNTDLLYTPYAIIVGELLLALPIIISLTHGSITALDQRLFETAQTLGAGWFFRSKTYIHEAKTGIILGILTAFARCLTELGIAMMVGGNIKERTRTLSTATAMETSKGEFINGMANGLVLLLLALCVTALIGLLSHYGEADE